MIVVDTNIVAYLYLPGNHTSRAEALLNRDPDWVAPLLWRSEFRNILAGYLRRQTLNFEQACQIQAEAEGLLTGNEHEVDSRHVLTQVHASACTAYDCEFIVLAQALNTRLVTMDTQLLRAFPLLTQALTD